MSGRPLSASVAARTGVAEVYSPVVDATRRSCGAGSPRGFFHEVLELRSSGSEQARQGVGTAEAVQSYVATLLPEPRSRSRHRR